MFWLEERPGFPHVRHFVCVIGRNYVLAYCVFKIRSETGCDRATAFGLLSACADGSNLPPPNFATNDAASSPRIYKIGIGDKLKVTVFGEENLSGQFEVITLA